MPSKLSPPPIQMFAELIEPNLNGAKLVSYESEYFTAPGDNYGSTIFKVTAKIRNTDSTLSELYLIAKFQPETEIMQQIFQPDRTFRTEECCYSVLAPALLQLQQNAGIALEDQTNVFAKCYGARTSLKPNMERVDSDAVLILENLTASGYQLGDKIDGFNLETTRVVLRDMAKFHAMTLVYRVKNPVEFNEAIRPFFKPFEVDVPEEMIKALDQDNLNIIENLAEVDDNLYEKVVRGYKRCKFDLTERPDTPFSTIIHNDFWTNNMMIRYGENENPLDMKMVDFQLAQYDSLINDLVFFIFTCVQSKIIKTELDELFKSYYAYYIECLKTLNYPIEEYSWERFENEVNTVAPLQFQHIISMFRFIMRKKAAPSNTGETKDNDALDHNLLHKNYFEKLKETILIFEAKGFI